MSFGFGTGDIVLFINFATKVVNAIRDEGGSQPEYQLADLQCKGFLTVMDEIKQLDLSNVPDVFRTHIEERSNDVQALVQEFKDKIAKYEKSMGKDSQRNKYYSAPRKVQWAFAAADDLALFRQALSAQLDLVKVTIQTSILAIVSNCYGPDHGSAPGMHAHMLPSSNFPQIDYNQARQQHLPWQYNPISALQLQDRVVNGLTGLVYERLLSKPGLMLGEQKKVYTLPDDKASALAFLTANGDSSENASEASALVPSSSQVKIAENNHVVPATRTQSAQRGVLEDDMNEYLRSMHLDELSGNEKKYLSDNIREPGSLLLTDSDLPASEGLNESNVKQQGHERTSNSRSSMKLGPIPDLSSNLSAGFGLSISMLQTIQGLARVGFSLSAVAKGDEMYKLLRGVRNCLHLLQVASQVIREGTFTGDLEQLAESAVGDGRRLVDYIQHVLESLVPTGPRTPSKVMLAIVRRNAKRSAVLRTMEELDSMKSNLGLLLQVHQVRIAEQNKAETNALLSLARRENTLQRA